jgi:hypothetical protein
MSQQLFGHIDVAHMEACRHETELPNELKTICSTIILHYTPLSIALEDEFMPWILHLTSQSFYKRKDAPPPRMSSLSTPWRGLLRKHIEL